VLTAINLDRGEILWQVARRHARQHPHASGAQGPEHSEDQPGRHVGRGPDGDQDARGDGRSAGPRKSRQPAARRDASRLDKKTGAQVSEIWMPAAQSGSPMTYSIDGRQFIVVAISGGNYTGEYWRGLAAERDSTDAAAARTRRPEL
jgi:quinoprotein glucose dehydrogenase